MGTLSSVAATSGDIRTDYLKLLVTQLRNQNPLDPLDNQQMASQLAQLSQLEQLENQTAQLGQLGRTFQEALVNAQRSEATNLLGREITFLALNEAGQVVETSAEVTRVEMADGAVQLIAGDYVVGLGNILSVRK